MDRGAKGRSAAINRHSENGEIDGGLVRAENGVSDASLLEAKPEKDLRHKRHYHAGQGAELI
jgi:hypothetical protein